MKTLALLSAAFALSALFALDLVFVRGLGLVGRFLALGLVLRHARDSLDWMHRSIAPRWLRISC